MTDAFPPPGPPDEQGSSTPPPPPGPPTPPPPGAYQQPTPPSPGAPGAPPTPPGQPQYGAPQYGAPQYGAPQYGASPPGGFQPPAVPYGYGSGLPSGAALASMGSRVGGWLIDWLILLVVTLPLYFGLSIALSSSAEMSDSSDLADALSASAGSIVTSLAIVALCVGIWTVYHAAFVATKGQTPGAMVTKVKVVNLSDGQIPSWGTAFKRALPNAVIVIPCCVGYLAILALYIWGLVNLSNNERRQTPFDLAAGTVVIDVS